MCGFSERVFVLLTFIIGNVPQRRVAGVTFALALTEASFNPALWKKISPARLEIGPTL